VTVAAPAPTASLSASPTSVASGGTSTVEKMLERVQYDLDYVKNWSLWLDVQIIARTALIILRDRNAY
jgi:lipopolysaccharide/colanic/teichoic acid biosynthesis glycosyltransferase